MNLILVVVDKQQKKLNESEKSIYQHYFNILHLLSIFITFEITIFNRFGVKEFQW